MTISISKNVLGNSFHTTTKTLVLYNTSQNMVEFYSYRNASTGCSFAACFEGK
jgi:hypothetical protein